MASSSSSTTTSPPSTSSKSRHLNNHSNQSSVAYYYGELKTGRRPLPPAPQVKNTHVVTPIIPSKQSNGQSHVNAIFVDGSSDVLKPSQESSATVDITRKTSSDRQLSEGNCTPFVTSVSIETSSPTISSSSSHTNSVGVTTGVNNNNDLSAHHFDEESFQVKIPLVSGSTCIVANSSGSSAVSPIPGPSTSNHHNNHVPPPAAFANPLLGIEADTRCSFETLSRSSSSRRQGLNDKIHHHRNLSNSSHLSNTSSNNNAGSPKPGIYQRSLTLLATGVSPLLKKRNPDIKANSSSNQRFLNNHLLPKPEEQTQDSRRQSEPVMFSFDSITNEINRLQQRHEQILENRTLDFDNMLLNDEDNFKQSQPLPSITANNGQQQQQQPSNQQSSQLSSPTSSSSANNQRSGHSSSSGHTNLASSSLMPSSEYGSRAGQQMHQQIPQHLQQHNFNSQSNPHQQGHHLSQQLFKEPLYMMYGDDNYGRGGSTGGPEENIYEEVDLMTLSSLRAQYADTLSLQSWKKKGGSKRALSNAASNSFSRWFSTRKKSPLVGGPDEENPYTMDVGKMSKKQRPPISLPDIPPEGLSQEQLKRRYILSSIVESENSYISSLHRLINEYKKPLEDTAPTVLSQNKINIIFYRLEQILQCHAIFGIALNQCVREWDQKERIGDVFIASFSKAMVLDIYSDFINNFTNAMETARKASKSKSAFAQFLQEKSISSPDRLSFFGLMVKPVQRFPQFILLLNDLLKHTPAEHADRMSLQLALTQLEALADRLNERKRDAERHFAVKQLLKDYLSSASSSPNRYLLRMDEVFLLDLDASTGLVVKVKIRLKDSTMNDRDHFY